MPNDATEHEMRDFRMNHYRDYLNTPAFFKMLPDVAGLIGLDVGYGEGHNTRLLAELGTQMTAEVDAPAR